MKTLIVIPDVCDVTGHAEKMTCLQNHQQEMCKNRTYRDEKGGLVAKTPYSWEELKEKVTKSDLQFGR